MATAKRIKVISTKWTSFETQLSSMERILEQDNYEITSLELRAADLRELFREFQVLRDDLAMLQPNNILLDDFNNILDRYYTLAGNIKNIVSAHTETQSVASIGGSQSASDGGLRVSEKDKPRIKLPSVSLPTFDGKYENWLSFKNTFVAMIHSQSGLDNMEKFHYLKSALTNEAANKIKVLQVTADNYEKAWKILERAYEVKRVLINQYLTLLTNLPVQREESAQGLDKLADDLVQYEESLKSLGVLMPEEALVHTIQTKLHRKTAEKWEESLEREEIPKLEKMITFLYKNAAMLSQRNSRGESSHVERNNKAYSRQPPIKRGRFDSPKHAFIINTSNNCVLCKDIQHPLYRCPKFKSLAVRKRLEVIKNARLCMNCMKYHKDSMCMYGPCMVCKKKHNTMLHMNSPSAAESNKTTKQNPANNKD